MRILFLLIPAAYAGALAAQPITSLPYSPSLDLTSMDRTVQACDDFYRYSCGNWIKKNPIPADQPGWDVYAKLAYDNERLLWGLLEEAAKPAPDRTAAQQKIGDFYHACMDEAAIDKAGHRLPFSRFWTAITRIKNRADLARFITAAACFRHSAGFWHFTSVRPGSGELANVIAFARRGRLGLPDRDYYTKTDAKSVEIRSKYVRPHEGSVRDAGRLARRSRGTCQDRDGDGNRRWRKRS